MICSRDNIISSPTPSLLSHIPSSASDTHLNTVCYSCMWEPLFTISTVWWLTRNNWNLLFLSTNTLVWFSIISPHKGCSNHRCMSRMFLESAVLHIILHTCCIGIFVWQPLVCGTQLLMSLNASSQSDTPVLSCAHSDNCLQLANPLKHLMLSMLRKPVAHTHPLSLRPKS